MSRARNKAIVEKQIELRQKLWPQITDTDLWLRKERDGFATIPRTLPLIMSIMDALTGKGKRVSSAYLVLWCQVMDEVFFEVKNEQALAFACGFEGERAVRTWRERMRDLQSLGFIDFKPGANGDITYILLLNPYHAIRRHREAKNPSITDKRYNSLIARAHEIKADDMDEVLPSDPITRLAPPRKKFVEALDDDIPF
jgi:hypothetical protein